MIAIQKVSNGYALQHGEQMYVFSNNDTTDHQAWADTLACVNELIGPTAGRNDKQRVYITVHPGDKHPDFTNELI